MCHVNHLGFISSLTMLLLVNDSHVTPSIIWLNVIDIDKTGTCLILKMCVYQEISEHVKHTLIKFYQRDFQPSGPKLQ